MNGFLDGALVGVLLFSSVAYAVSALGPRNLRRRLLAASSAWLARAPAAFKLRGAAQWMAGAAETKSGACGGCDNCAAERSAAGATQSGSPVEIEVPISRIGRAGHSRRS